MARGSCIAQVHFDSYRIGLCRGAFFLHLRCGEVMQQELVTRFPTTRFYGSKRRQVEWIRDSVASLKTGNVLDLFGGTATTSLLFRSLGHHVIFNDALEFNRVCARALSKRPRGFGRKDLDDFCNSIEPKRGFVAKTFDRRFYRRNENMWLDGAIDAISLIGNSHHRDIVYYCLIQACLMKRPFNLFHRANLYLRQNFTSSSFGNKTTWETPFSIHMRKAYSELELAWGISCGGLRVVKDEGEIDSGSVDIVYLDPPYIPSSKKSIESYIFRYHFLEGLVRPEEWPAMVDMASPIRCFKPEYFPREWVREEQIIEGLRELIDVYGNASFVMSYAAGASPDVARIRRIFRKEFSSEQVFRKKYGAALSKTQREELLFIGVRDGRDK